jgi:hypothetical protein
MDWVWQPDETSFLVPLSVTKVYQLEQETGMLLTDLFRPVEVLVNVTAADGTTTEVATTVEKEETDDIINSLLQEQIVLDVSLHVRQQLTRNGRQVLETIVTCQYLSESGIPADLPAVLLQVINNNQLPNDVFWALQSLLAVAIGETDALTLSFSIRSSGESKILESVYQIDEPDVPLDDGSDDGRGAADMGLIAAVIILSVMVAVVSGVLLYITGGWSACHQAVSNCLFEEVDDDYDAPQRKNNFRVSTGSYDDEGDEEEEYSDEGDEEGSIETGIATNPTGILGVQSQDENADPMAGLGIKTPNRKMYDNQNVDMTPMSAMTTNDNDAPLGIMSMRKLPQPETPEVRGGLAHMIMERVAKATTYTPKK